MIFLKFDYVFRNEMFATKIIIYRSYKKYLCMREGDPLIVFEKHFECYISMRQLQETFVIKSICVGVFQKLETAESYNFSMRPLKMIVFVSESRMKNMNGWSTKNATKNNKYLFSD